MKEVRVPGQVRNHNNKKKNHRKKKQEQEKRNRKEGGHRMEKDSISPPRRNLTKEVATLTKEMKKTQGFQ